MWIEWSETEWWDKSTGHALTIEEDYHYDFAAETTYLYSVELGLRRELVLSKRFERLEDAKQFASEIISKQGGI